MDYTHEDTRASLLYNSNTKKLTVTHKNAGFSKRTFYGPITLNDVRDLTALLNAEPDAALVHVLEKWENI